MKHFLELILFLILVSGPIPLCIGFNISQGDKHKNNSLSHFLFTLLTGWTVIQVLIGLILGIIKELTLFSMVITELIFFTAGIFFIIHFKKNTPFPWIRDCFKRESHLTHPQKHILYMVILLGIGLTCLVMIQPVTDYDSLAYHLPSMARWYQSGELVLNDQFKDQQIGYYPYTWELFCTLFLFPFGEDLPVAFPNIVLWFQLGLSIYLISVMLGAGRTYGLLGASLVSTLPVVISGINKVSTDLPLVIFFLAGLYFILCFEATPSLYYFLLSWASITMLPGIKTSGFVYGFVLLVALSFLLIRFFWNRRKNKKFIHPLTIRKILYSIPGVLILILPGIYWYIRNFILLGNPLGFVQLKLGDWEIFPGPLRVSDIKRTTLAQIFDFFNSQDWKILIDQIDKYLGPAFYVLLLLALIFTLSLFSKANRKNKKNFLFLVILLGITIYFYWTTPYSADNGLYGWRITPYIGQGMRFGLPFMGILGIMAAIGAQKIKLKEQIVITLFLGSYVICIMQTGIIIQSKLLVYGFGVVLLIGGILFQLKPLAIPSGIFKNILNMKGKAVVLIISIILLVIGLFIFRQVRDINRVNSYGKVVKYIEKNVSPGETIGFFLTHRSYLLYGKNLNRKVRYIPLNFKNRYRFLGFLRSRKVSVIAVGPLQEGWFASKELSWLRNSEKKFEKVFGINPGLNMFLYKVKP